VFSSLIPPKTRVLNILLHALRAKEAILIAQASFSISVAKRLHNLSALSANPISEAEGQDE